MADMFKALLKATRLARKRQARTAKLLFPTLMTPPKKARAKRVTPAKPRPVRTAGTASRNLPRPAPGSILTDDFTCAHGALTYQLYTPTGSDRRRMPLVVMLHGCTQTAWDFATGTGMNALADQLGFLVLYPQQSSSANMARCWNWHDPLHQGRDHGEPAVIAALTRHAMALGRANPARVYIAGISAGGAAAAMVGAAYPDIFVAVGVHSGVARGEIRSLGGALAAMNGRTGPASTATLPRQLPTIVFHGDGDRVVHPSNAAGFRVNVERSGAGPLTVRSNTGRSPGGRDYTRRIYKGRSGDILLEDWTIHGSGHSWSGGSPLGSHTDPAGPDASREMLRFFFNHKRPA